MAVTDQERLVVSLEARIRDFEKNMAKAQRSANDNFKGIEARGKKSAKALEGSFSGIGRGLAAGIGDGLKLGLAGLTIGGAFAGLKAVTGDLAQLNAEAKRAGVGAEAFQELGYAAAQSRVGLDALTDGLKELQLRADEFIVTGQGSAAEAFGRLGYTAEHLSKKLADPAALFEEAIDKLSRLDRASQIRIADELFGGTGGEQFVQMLDKGVGSVRQLRQEARDAGNVVSQELIDKAVELDQKFAKIATTISTNLKSALVGVVGLMSQFVDMLNQPGNQSTDTLRQRLELAKSALPRYKAYGFSDTYIADREAEVRQLEAEISKRPATSVTVNPRPSAGAGDKLAGLNSDFSTRLQSFMDSANALGYNIGVTSGFRSVQRQQELWDEALRKYGSVAEARKWVAPPGSSNHNKGMAADLSFGSDAAKKWAHENAGAFGLNFRMGNEPWHVEPKGSGKGSGDPATDILQSGRERVAQLQIENQALGMTTRAAAAYRFEQDLLAQAQKEGIQLSPEQVAGIRQLAQEYGNLEAAAAATVDSQQRAAQAAAEVNSIGRDVLGGVISDLRAGASGADILANALSRVADRLIDIGLNAIFPTDSSSGGIFGSLLGGIFGMANGGAVHMATGGPVSGPGTGRSDSVPAWLSNGEFVVNAAATARHRALLERINSGQGPAFADGGLVGSAASVQRVANSKAITIGDINVTMPAGSSGTGDPAKDAAAAREQGKAIGREVRNQVLAIIADEQRPGGALWSGKTRR